jgi:Leucine-rich repeat (LRR) protein
VIPTTPKAALTDRLKEKIKLVMVSRFNKDTKALDLTRLHIDPGLFYTISVFVALNNLILSELVEDSCCAVSRPAVMTVILDVISENIPELQALNLDHNMLSVTETLSSLPRKAPNLQILYLGKNRVRVVDPSFYLLTSKHFLPSCSFTTSTISMLSKD